MAFFQIASRVNFDGEDPVWQVGIEEGSLRRKNRRSGVSRSVGGLLLMDRKTPGDTLTCETVFLTRAEHERVAAYFGGLLQERHVELSGDFNGTPGRGPLVAIAQLVGTNFVTAEYRKCQLEITEFL